MLAGFLLRALGVTDAAEVPKFLWTQTFPWSLLLPIFIFAVVVFMLSTISGFISAMSYVAHYDLIPLLGLHESQTTATSPRRPLSTLKTARTTTVVTVLVIYVLYLLLRAYLGRVEPATAQGEQIGQVLYAIYAFQLSITPTVLIALFSRSITLRAWAVLVSTAIGLITALLTSTESKPLFDISKDSWDVIPPLAVLFTASISYLLVHWVTGLGGRK